MPEREAAYPGARVPNEREVRFLMRKSAATLVYRIPPATRMSKPSAVIMLPAILARSIRSGTYDSLRVNRQAGAGAELLHHRPHRSWEVHAGRPAPRVHPLDQPARHAGPGPGQHGPG